MKLGSKVGRPERKLEATSAKKWMGHDPPGPIASAAYSNVRRILVRGVNAPLLPEAKKILKI